MMRIAGKTSLALCALLVVYAEGIHLIALWNLLPLLLLALVSGSGGGHMSWAALAFATVTTLAIALTHTAWVFDWGDTQTGSSTAGLIFLFSPIYSLLLGACGWAVVKVAERLARVSKHWRAP